MSINVLPPILDFEASSLSDCSYPITVGLVVSSEIKHWIVKPQPDWIDWSLASQSIHGIKRSYLMEHGLSASQVTEEMKMLLRNHPIIYSDNPHWESRWLRCLGTFDCEVRDIRELLTASLHASFPTYLDRQFAIHGLTRHRADHDAYAMYLAVSELRGMSLSEVNPKDIL